MDANEFKRRLDAIPVDVPIGMGSTAMRRDPMKVGALCSEALYSISINGDLASRRLANEMLKAMK